MDDRCGRGNPVGVGEDHLVSRAYAQGGHAEMERAGATRGGDSVFDAQVRLEGRLEAVQVVIALRAPTVTRGVGGVAHFQFGD